ncbi:MAG: DNA repair protein RecN [Provencibacterium sp.]|jgi:DNA repair protein RecN (Recombination protein N)|nr:DNA repair protein RecN [Provencibacterium sp.]
MLRSLYIENLAVFSRAEIAFTPGLNVFTGETGAGKTILISSIGAVLGQRVSRELIRTGESRAQVSAVFSPVSAELTALLEELGFEPPEDGELLLSRVIRPDSAECRINGRPATAAALRALAHRLIDLHGQRDNQKLLSSDYHLSLIDHYGGCRQLIQEYGEVWKQLCEVRIQLRALQLDEGEKARRIDLLSYQIEEISRANLREGEQEELEAQRKLMRGAGKVADALSEAKELLNPETQEAPGLEEQLTVLIEALETAAHYLPELQQPLSRLTDFSYELSDLGRELSGYLESVDFSPRQLDEVEERLSLLHALEMKYGGSIPETLAFLARAEEELQNIRLSGERTAALKKEERQLLERAEKLAAVLSGRRQKAAAAFEKAVGEQLRFLDMPGARLAVSLCTKDLGPAGADSAQLLFAANPGDEPRLLQKAASGGEISRLMLSIKNVLSEEEDEVTAIFDEIDTGVSGRAADRIGRGLAVAAAGRQVLCVTHLAQVAAYADHHLLIEKSLEKGQASTCVRALDGEGRAGELARIASGDAHTEAALLNAQEMLARAQEAKREERRQMRTK